MSSKGTLSFFNLHFCNVRVVHIRKIKQRCLINYFNSRWVHTSLRTMKSTERKNEWNLPFMSSSIDNGIFGKTKILRVKIDFDSYWYTRNPENLLTCWYTGQFPVHRSNITKCNFELSNFEQHKKVQLKTRFKCLWLPTDTINCERKVIKVYMWKNQLDRNLIRCS